MRIRSFILPALILAAPLSARAQWIESSIYADDEFKIFISNSANTRGVEFAQGAGWAINFQNRLYLYPGVTTYFMHVWVRDVGGSPTGLLGQFRLSNHRGCRFANGATTLLTNTTPGNWRISPRIASTTPLTGGPPGASYFNNAMPAFATATLPVVSLGTNAANPWPTSPVPKPFGGVSGAAHWIWGPRIGPAGPVAWFTTRITCTTPTLVGNPN
jgi:hypothetical protein